MSEKLLTIGQVSDRFGLSIEALRKWDDSGKLKALRRRGGHRRYRVGDVQSFLGLEVEDDISRMPVAVYVRVSSHDQKKAGDLDRQKGRVLHYCVEKGYQTKYVLEEVGSGISPKRTKLKRLFRLASEKKISRVVVEHKDRLTRFMFDIFVVFFETYGIKIEWVEETLPKTYEAELVEDILTLMSSFSAKIYGKRSARNRKKVEV
jgi:predicted site-specific integrase-resolvase